MKILEMKHALLFSFLILIGFGCKNDSSATQIKPNDQVVENNQKFSDLPALPQDDLLKLFEEATYIDYIFYNLPFSISQDDQPSIHSNLRLISPEKMGAISAACKPIGREFFHIGGAISFEAEVFFDNGCYGYVFYKDKKPVYANKISESGMKFYTNIIAQAQQIQNKAINGR